MTDEQIEYLGTCWRGGSRSPWLLRQVREALRAVERGEADAGFGRDLSVMAAEAAALESFDPPQEAS